MIVRVRSFVLIVLLDVIGMELLSDDVGILPLLDHVGFSNIIPIPSVLIKTINLRTLIPG